MRPPFAIYGGFKKGVFHVFTKHHEQGINVLSQTDYLPIRISSILIDRRTQGFVTETVKFNKKKLKYFADYYEG
jgi:hypothetical protein